SVAVIANPATRLNMIVPSDTLVGSPFRIILRAEDEQGNLAAGYRGTVVLKLNRGSSTLPAAYTFRPSDRRVHIFPEVRFSGSGLYRIQASDPSASISTESNPSRCSDQRRSPQVFWG